MNDRGSALVLNLLGVSVFTILAGVVYVGARSQVKVAVYNMRQAQAQAVADAGLENALLALRNDPDWRTGYVNKALGDATYTVTLTTGTPTQITSTGYSKSIFGFGAAVKTVTVTSKFIPSGCPYAIAGNGPLELNGLVNRYDADVTLTPATTEFTNGADVRSNSNLSVSGACTTANIRGDATIMTTGPSAACVEGTIYTTTQTLTIPTASCPTCETINDNLTGISPQSVYNASAKKLTIGNSDVVTFQPGTYFFRTVSIRGTMNVDTSSGTVYIYLEPSTFGTFTGCQINNLSKVPSRLRFADIGVGGHTLDFRCSTPLHAYFEGSFAKTDIYQEMYGHLCSDKVYLDSTAKMHWDGSSLEHAGWTLGASGSWQESFERP